MIVYEELTEQIIGAAIDVHKELGPGLLESAYRQCFAHELRLRGLAFQMEVGLPVKYKGIRLDCGYRMDFIVEGKVLVENKSVERMHPIFEAQLLTYLRLSELRVGLLINYNVPILKQGIVRRVL